MIWEVTRYFGLVCGVTLLISFASILAPLRTSVMRLSQFFGSMLYCPMCTGFWVGVGFGLANAYPFQGFIGRGPTWFMAGLESGIFSMAFMFIVTQLTFGGGNPAYEIEQRPTDDEKKEKALG